jgi:lipopolysaccharide transport system ATP-binding protein
MTDIAIRVSNLSKCYQIYDSPRDRLKQFVVPRLQGIAGKAPKQYFREFWALKDVSFEIKKGETVGIIGRNGSGKSTLLQMIYGTLSPTSGNIQTNGRIAALLELGSGFNPEFTGRENVRMSCALLGLSTEETEGKFDAIAAFADIGDFIEQPVKTYSSGMFVRLAFAVNIISVPEIMIVDEALAVGDMNFQAKCMTAMTRLQESGATVLFVSHNVGAVKSLCSRAIYLEHGKVNAVGKASEIAEQYIRTMREEMNAEQCKSVTTAEKIKAPMQPTENVLHVTNENVVFKRSLEFDKKVASTRYGTGSVKATYVELLNLNDEPISFVAFNEKVKVRVFFESFADKTFSVNVSVYDEKKNNITGCGFRHVDQPYLNAHSGEKFLVEYIFQLPLQEGAYSIRVNISTPIIEDETAEFIDLVNDAIVFQIGRWDKARVWSQVHQFAEFNVMRLT